MGRKLPPVEYSPVPETPVPAETGGRAPGGPLAFTYGSWFTWTAVGVSFPVLTVFLLGAAPLLAQGAYEAFPLFAATHVATLGWGTMTIMGASAQMAPALLGARIRAEHLLPWQYAVFTGGVAALVAGFAAGRLGVVIAGAVAVNLGAWIFIVLMVLTAASAARRARVLTPHLPVALACFALVLVWGTILAADLRWGFWPALLLGHRGLAVHLTLGLGGWFGLTVVGVFYRLVPLVHGARVQSARRGWAILGAAGVALGGALAGALGDVAWPARVAALAAAGALLLFCWEILHVLAHRRSRAPDLNVAHWHAVVAYSLLLAASGLLWAVHGIPPAQSGRFGESAVTVFLLGWVTQAIIGQLYKVTPFLMWYYRATIPDVLAIPRQPAPYNPPLGRLVLWLSNAGVLVLVAGIWWGSPGLAELGAGSLAGASLALAYMLAYRWIPPAASRALVFEWRWRIS